MYLSQDRASQVSGGVFLMGLALLFYTGDWWPWILFVIAASSLAQGLVQGRLWYTLQSEIWLIGIGVWAFFHFSIWVLLAVLGASMIVSAFIRPPMFASKPQVDNTLE
jgi:hypothetical protein